MLSRDVPSDSNQFYTKLCQLGYYYDTSTGIWWIINPRCSVKSTDILSINLCQFLYETWCNRNVHHSYLQCCTDEAAGLHISKALVSPSSNLCLSQTQYTKVSIVTLAASVRAFMSTIEIVITWVTIIIYALLCLNSLSHLPRTTKCIVSKSYLPIKVEMTLL